MSRTAIATAVSFHDLKPKAALSFSSVRPTLWDARATDPAPEILLKFAYSIEMLNGSKSIYFKTSIFQCSIDLTSAKITGV